MSKKSMANAGKSGKKKALAVTLALCTPLLLGACNSTTQVFTHGYQVNEDTLALVPVGSSQEQVLLSLGTPSTKQTQDDGSETFYYISQTKVRRVAFGRSQVVDQRVLAIYLNTDGTVDRIANYGLKDGKVFDFIRRVTPTGGADLSFIGQLLSVAGKASPSSLLNRG